MRQSLLRIFSSFSEYLNRLALRHLFILIDVWIMYNPGNLYRLFFPLLLSFVARKQLLTNVLFFLPRFLTNDSLAGKMAVIFNTAPLRGLPTPASTLWDTPLWDLRRCYYFCFSVESHCAAVAHCHFWVFPFKADKCAAGDIALPWSCRHTGYLKYIRHSQHSKT